jgi:hypothetical protein
MIDHCHEVKRLVAVSRVGEMREGPLLFRGSAQRPRLEEIRDNLADRIAEAHREGWLGEIEGLQISLTGAEEKLDQLDAAQSCRENTRHPGLPALPSATGFPYE